MCKSKQSLNKVKHNWVRIQLQSISMGTISKWYYTVFILKAVMYLCKWYCCHYLVHQSHLGIVFSSWNNEVKVQLRSRRFGAINNHVVTVLFRWFDWLTLLTDLVCGISEECTSIIPSCDLHCLCPPTTSLSSSQELMLIIRSCFILRQFALIGGWTLTYWSKYIEMYTSWSALDWDWKHYTTILQSNSHYIEFNSIQCQLPIYML